MSRGSLIAVALAVSSFFSFPRSAQAVASDSLKIYFIDVEGGQATLFVTPTGQSMLVDTGWPGFTGRDAGRIVAAAKAAGLSRIDYILITHFHMDHVGGAPQLAERFPIGTFIDHGENRETGDQGTMQVWQAYEKLLREGKYKHLVARPGDKLPITGMDAVVVSADGNLLGKPLPGAGGDNPACQGAEQYPADTTENMRSLGFVATFGKLRILDLGDLTRDKEMELMCPVNKLGKLDIYVVSHHGSEQSGSSALVHGIAPRVAIMDNGARKGGSSGSSQVIKKSPHIEDLWQLHYAEGDLSYNVPSELIANAQGPDSGEYLVLTARPDGSFEVYNSRLKRTKRYEAKAH
ncbi:MAG TPA: MBL fold metallo-hydrolase [Terriglobales bacterium]|jgi:competence protein ComEC|nr:MBL fold metallo-hydrolase [Terriglobales bacterium]